MFNISKIITTKFWKKIENCDHMNLSTNYLVPIKCGTPYCSGTETHCLDCGAYLSKCSCGCNNGISGWSDKRHRNRKRGKK